MLALSTSRHIVHTLALSTGHPIAVQCVSTRHRLAVAAPYAISVLGSGSHIRDLSTACRKAVPHIATQ
eukprot:3026002-Rhodomonas_salina.2